MRSPVLHFLFSRALVVVLVKHPFTHAGAIPNHGLEHTHPEAVHNAAAVLTMGVWRVTTTTPDRPLLTAVVILAPTTRLFRGEAFPESLGV